MIDDERFTAAIAAIDRANADDPHRLVVDGVERPKELAHAELMTAWVRRLDAAADEAQLLAARAHHLRRWSIPRSSYPDGRSGYLQWRTALSKQHAEEVAELLSDVGYEAGLIDRVQALVRKRGLGTDPQVQTHEDALCLVFLQTQFAAVTDRLGEDKIVEVLAKTLPKMSSAGVAAVSTLELDETQLALVHAAIAQTTRDDRRQEAS